MRWKLFRRRLSISAPRMIIRSHAPWPVRWAVLALMLGFSAALGLWAFEVGKDIAGLDRGTKEELVQLRAQVESLIEERDRAQSVANSADSLLKAERVAQERLAQEVKQLESDNLAMKADLGFFQRLLPASGEGVGIRGLEVEKVSAGRLSYQLVVMTSSKSPADFNGRYEIQLTGRLANKAWSFVPAGPVKSLRFKQSARVEGLVDHPPEAMVQTLQVKLVDAAGVVRATQTVKL